MVSENLKDVTLQLLKDLRADMRELCADFGALRTDVGELRAVRDDRRFLEQKSVPRRRRTP